MVLFATYCSAEKDGASGMQAAIDRYRSARIRGVHTSAAVAGAKFGILSGQYGLIAADHPIPYYDHLLQTDEIEPMVAAVQATLESWQITEVRWFSVAFEMDPHVGRYRAVMERAAAEMGAQFELTLWEPIGTLGLV